MSWFTNAMRDLASRKGARKLKTTISRKTESGNVVTTVKGIVATDSEELAEKAIDLGVTVAGKGGSFGAAEGTQGGSLVDDDAGEWVELMCDPESFQEEARKPKRKGKKKSEEAEGTDVEEETQTEVTV